MGCRHGTFVLQILKLHISRGNTTQECKISQSPFGRAHIYFRVDATDLILRARGDTLFSTCLLYRDYAHAIAQTLTHNERQTAGGVSMNSIIRDYCSKRVKHLIDWYTHKDRVFKTITI